MLCNAMICSLEQREPIGTTFTHDALHVAPKVIKVVDGDAFVD